MKNFKICTASILAVSFLLVLGAGCGHQTSIVTPFNQKVTPETVQINPVDTSADSSSRTEPAPTVFRTTLSLGSSGTVVADVQQFLADEGLYSGSDSQIFDQATANAVSAFQRQENIKPDDGVWGKAEQNAANAIIVNHPDWLTTISNDTVYSNINGSPVHSPTKSTSGIPAGATARCRDNTYSFSMHRSGTCSHHDGVAEWLTR